jgi:hypothetical protein
MIPFRSPRVLFLTAFLPSYRHFGGQSRTSQVNVRHGVLEIPLRERSEAGVPLEWIQVEIQA